MQDNLKNEKIKPTVIQHSVKIVAQIIEVISRGQEVRARLDDDEEGLPPTTSIASIETIGIGKVSSIKYPITYFQITIKLR